jgi:hypothetical protein
VSERVCMCGACACPCMRAPARDPLVARSPITAMQDWDFAKIVPGEHSTYNYPDEQGCSPQ